MASFGPIAPHYDLLMSNVPYDMWASYYRLLLASHHLNPETLLDVCCGTGSVAEFLADDGYIVEGFDLSEAMIAEARRKEESAQRGITYHVADATRLDLGKKFDSAYSFFDSLNYITTLEGVTQAIIGVGRHLVDDGSLIFDVNTAYAFEEKMFDQKDMRKRAAIQYDWKGNYDPESRIIRVDMKFWRDGEEFEEVHVQRAHSDEEIREALRLAGFAQVRAYDSYTLDPVHRKSDRVHYVVKMAQ